MFESIGQPASSATPAPKPPSTPLEIHTMPERFLGASSKTGGGPMPAPQKGSKKLILAIGIIVVVLLGAGAAIMFTGVLDKNSANTSNVNLVTNTPVTNTNANKNANSNVNTNKNDNANLNTNANSNSNLNANANVNTNGNANTNANSNVNSNPLAASSIDTDKDGLTDAEESVYSTNPSSQDSDGDGFLDGSEIKLGYNPKGAGKLSASVLVSTYTNSLYGATVLYPRSWTTVARTSTEQLFSNPSNDETIIVSIQNNAARQTAKQWYIQEAPSVDATTITDVQTWDKLSSGIMTPDGNAYYFANGSQVYSVSLSYGPKPSVDSRTTLEMFARSLTVDPSKVNLNTNTNTANTNTTNTNTNANDNTNASNTNTNAY
ncbi:MAG: hypothetical protein AAB445_04145, partial [Patescibacteria group bacterium]